MRGGLLWIEKVCLIIAIYVYSCEDVRRTRWHSLESSNILHVYILQTYKHTFTYLREVHIKFINIEHNRLLRHSDYTFFLYTLETLIWMNQWLNRCESVRMKMVLVFLRWHFSMKKSKKKQERNRSEREFCTFSFAYAKGINGKILTVKHHPCGNKTADVRD